MTTIPADRLAQALALRDLTDPSAGEHAVQHVVAAVEAALVRAWRVPVRHAPGPRIVTVADNYDRLRYHPDAVTRDRRYTRYVGPGRMLRSHTTAYIPALLDRLDGTPDVVLSVPGICYRRDVIDARHVGEPHQLDLWRIRRGGPPLREADLAGMLAAVLGAVLPDQPWHTPPSPHPYTTAGTTGLAMGLGLDRLTMLVKGVPDIRLLRATDPRVAGQMRDLAPYRPVSSMPPVPRDLSLAVAADLDAELLGDRVRELLGPDADAVEEVVVLASTPYDALPRSARERMGVRPGQRNLLVRVVLRALTRTLSAAEANVLRDRIYAGLHEGERHEWSAHPA